MKHFNRYTAPETIKIMYLLQKKLGWSQVLIVEHPTSFKTEIIFTKGIRRQTVKFDK